MYNSLNYNSNSLPVGNNFYLFFCSSILVGDFINRFKIRSRVFDKLITRGMKSLFIEFKFKLTMGNSFSKFRNRVHFILYYLFFEMVTGQRPKIVVNKESGGSSLSKNKREFKKAQLLTTVDSFKFTVSLTTFNQMMVFLNFIIFFIAPLTSKERTVLSKRVGINLETSELAVVGSLRNLSLLSFSNFVDDLSGLGTEFKFKLVPFDKKCFLKENLLNTNNLFGYYANSLGLVLENLQLLEKPIFNLRRLTFYTDYENR